MNSRAMANVLTLPYRVLDSQRAINVHGETESIEASYGWLALTASSTFLSHKLYIRMDGITAKPRSLNVRGRAKQTNIKVHIKYACPKDGFYHFR